MIPQLRVRTEFSFRYTFGPIKLVAQRLEEAGCPAAGCVDMTGTWGHVRWEKALSKTNVKPLYGREFVVANESGRRPVSWALATDTKDFYNLSTALEQAPNSVETPLDLSVIARHKKSNIIFSGAALTDPELFDYVDLNPASLLQQKAALELAIRTGKPIVITSDNAYPTRAEEKQFLAIADRTKATPQWLLSEAEMRKHIRVLSDEQFAQAVRNVHEVVERCAAARLREAPLISVEGDLRALAAAGKAERIAKGHIENWDETYEARFQRELDMIEAKKFESYFLVVSDMVRWAKTRMLVGPGRGSSAGSLVCYCLGITEVDPIPHKLLFERFIDVTRNDLPDIDIDFSDTKRDQVFEYLASKYGAANVARIGNVNTLKPNSVLAQVGKRMGIPIHDTFDLKKSMIVYSSGDSRYGKGLEDTMNGTDAGINFMKKYPEAAVIADLEGHASHAGVHAAGVIVSTEPVSDYCTVKADGIAQIDKPDAERLNLLKIDALGLRTLGIIEDTGVVDAETLYGLKLNDPEVLSILNERKYCGIFQFAGGAQGSVANALHFDSFEVIDHTTALARPGPLAGGASQHYIKRKAGQEPVTYSHPSLEPILKSTYGVVLYQEQVMQIVRDIGKFSWEDTTVIRKAMSGRKGKEFFDRNGIQFVKGAAEEGIDTELAQQIWSEICTFGAWGMNKSHTVAYAVISYWCCWLKRYHKMEFAAACLRSAKEEQDALAMLREMANEGIEYVPFDIDRSEVDWTVKDGQLIGGFKNLIGYGNVKAVTAVEQRRMGTLDREKVLAAKPLFQEIYPMRTTYADMYRNPKDYDIIGQIREIKDLRPFLERHESDVTLVRVIDKVRRDQNEDLLVKKRDGQRKTGQTLFLDMKVIDDSVEVPFTARLQPRYYNTIGRFLSERLENGKDVLLLRGRRYLDSGIFHVDKVKCITNPGIFDEEQSEPNTESGGIAHNPS